MWLWLRNEEAWNEKHGFSKEVVELAELLELLEDLY